MKYLIFLYSGNETNAIQQKTLKWFISKLKILYPNFIFSNNNIKSSGIFVKFIDTFIDIKIGTLEQYFKKEYIDLNDKTMIIVLDSISNFEITDISTKYKNLHIKYFPLLNEFKNVIIKKEIFNNIILAINEFKEYNPIKKINNKTLNNKKEIIHNIFDSLSDSIKELINEQSLFLAGGYKETPFLIDISNLSKLQIAIYPDNIELPKKYKIEMHFTDALNLAMIMHSFSGSITKIIDKETFLNKTNPGDKNE